MIFKIGSTKGRTQEESPSICSSITGKGTKKSLCFRRSSLHDHEPALRSTYSCHYLFFGKPSIWIYRLDLSVGFIHPRVRTHDHCPPYQLHTRQPQTQPTINVIDLV